MVKIIVFLCVWMISYLVLIRIKFGKLPAISASQREWVKLRRLYGIFFLLFCVGLSVPLIMIADKTDSGWFVFAGAGFIFAGTAFASKNKSLTRTVHNVGAVVGIGFSLIAEWVVLGYWLPAIATIVGGLVVLLAEVKNPVYWIQIWAFVMFIAGLIYTIF